MFIRPHLTALTLAGVLLGATLSACSGNSQQPAPEPPGQQAQAGHHRNAMREALASVNLTADERSKIDAFQQQYRASRQTQTPETRMQLMQQVEGVLTPQQLADFKSNMKSIRKQMRADRQAQGTAPAPQAS